MRVLTIWMAGTGALDRLKALSDSGVEVGLLCARRWLEAGAELTPPPNPPFPVFTRATTFTGRGAYYMFVPGVSGVVKDFQPDLIHVREEMYTSFAGQFLAERSLRFRNIPFVFESWQNIRKRYPWPARWFEAVGYRGSSGAIAGTPPVESVLRTGGFRGPVRVIPLGGVSHNTFAPVGPGMRSDLPGGLLVGYVGRLVPEKGIDLLLRASARSRVKFTVVVVGDGQKRPVLESLARELKVDAKFLGPVAVDNVPSLLRSLDLLVLPSRTTSRWKEQWGRVLTEAMACGTPVVGSSSGEIPFVMGEAGRIFEEGSVEDLARLLDEILPNKEALARMREAGLARAKEFSWDRHAASTREFFEEVLSGRS